MYILRLKMSGVSWTIIHQGSLDQTMQPQPGFRYLAKFEGVVQPRIQEKGLGQEWGFFLLMQLFSFAVGVKNKNLVGQSRMGVLVVRFSQMRAL